MRASNPRPNRLFLLTIEFARPSLKPQAPDSPSEQARGQPSTAAIGFASLRPVWQALVERGRQNLIIPEELLDAFGDIFTYRLEIEKPMPGLRQLLTVLGQ